MILPPSAIYILRAKPSESPLPRPDIPDIGLPFLPKPAKTVAELTKETEGYKDVRIRYARFFHLPPQDVAHYFSVNAVAGKLARAGRYTVFHLSHAGIVYPARITLPAKTAIFIGRDGAPMLLSGTGDPLIPFAPVVDIDLVPGGSDTPRKIIQQMVPTAPATITLPTVPIR